MGKNKTHEEFVSEVNNKFGKNTYTILSEYKKAIENILVRHNVCGSEFLITPHNLLRRESCRVCSNNRLSQQRRETLEDVKLKIYNLVGDEYSLLSSEYISSQHKIIMRHNSCGHEYEVKMTKFYIGQRCPVCSIVNAHIKQTKTQEEFEKEVLELTNKEYRVIGEYINSHSKILIKHNICDNLWEITPSAFLKGNRCPHCSNKCNPKGEVIINDFLIKNNINFQRQYKFNDCRNKNPLPFDFAVFNNEKKLKFLIEFQGLQHEKSVEYFGGEESFKTRKLNDSIKENYCIKHNIKLLKIHYKDLDNIENILYNYLFELKMIA